MEEFLHLTEQTFHSQPTCPLAEVVRVATFDVVNVALTRTGAQARGELTFANGRIWTLNDQIHPFTTTDHTLAKSGRSTEEEVGRSTPHPPVNRLDL